MNQRFETELAQLINRHCVDNDLNQKDYILAKYLVQCLKNYEIMFRYADDRLDEILGLHESLEK